MLLCSGQKHSLDHNEKKEQEKIATEQTSGASQPGNLLALQVPAQVYVLFAVSLADDHQTTKYPYLFTELSQLMVEQLNFWLFYNAASLPPCKPAVTWLTSKQREAGDKT